MAPLQHCGRDGDLTHGIVFRKLVVIVDGENERRIRPPVASCALIQMYLESCIPNWIERLLHMVSFCMHPPTEFHRDIWIGSLGLAHAEESTAIFCDEAAPGRNVQVDFDADDVSRHCALWQPSEQSFPRSLRTV